MTENKSEPSGPSLLAFPTEVLRMICENLCDHCTASKNTKAFIWAEEATHCGTLLDLSKTCRVLRDIAQPMAYHALSPIPLDQGFSDFIRTLAERPDLAAQIRWLRPDCYWCGGWGSLELEAIVVEAKVVKAVATRLGMQHWSDMDFKNVENNRTSLAKFCTELLIALAPNLEWLQVDIENEQELNAVYDTEEYYDEGTQYQHTAERCEQLGLQAASMRQLKRLDFTSDDDWGVDAKVGAIPVLLSLAPNLEHLSLSLCRGLGHEEYDPQIIFRDGAGSSLRVVELKHCALEADAVTESLISDIVSHAPNLEHFSYYSVGAFLGERISRHFSAADFLRCLEPTRHSLKYLDIDLTEHSLNKISSDLLSPAILQSFTALTTLKLDETSFCRHRRDPHAMATCLTDILPINIETLSIRLYEGNGAWVDLERLSMETGKYPSLRRIQVRNIPRKHSNTDQDEFLRTCEDHCDALGHVFIERNIDFHPTEILDHQAFREIEEWDWDALHHGN